MTESLRTSLYSLTLREIRDFLSTHEHSPHLAVTVYESLYKKNISNQFSEKTLNLIDQYFEKSLPEIVSTKTAEDGTIKFLMQFNDGKKVETVLIPFFKKFTVCLSSQVGCAMKCSFCYTGTQGLTRNLKSHEIIGQYIKAKQYLEQNISKDSLTPNIVLMGQGEPLHNFDEVQKALEIMLDPLGLAIGPRQITLSTAGFLPGLKKFNQLPKVNLALSLHSPFNEIRKTLIPITGQFPLEDIFSALDQVELMKRQFVTFEYLLIDGVNDRDEDVEELSRLLGHRKAIINIIPFNPFPGSEFKRPTHEGVETFKEKLVEKKLRTMIRTTKGSDILAACGQLVS
jgi:23S rRNA (adenine2503-C2)-methyltransferase